MISLKSRMEGRTWLYICLSLFFTGGGIFTFYDMFIDFELIHCALLFLFGILSVYFTSEVLSAIYVIQICEENFKYRRLIFKGSIIYEDIEQLIELKARKRIGYSHYIKVKLYNGDVLVFSVDCLKDKEKQALKNSLREATSKSFLCEVSRFY